MSRSLLLGLLFKPMVLFLHNSSFTLSLNFHSRRLVCLQLIRDIGLFGWLRGFGSDELLHMAFGVGGFESGCLVGFQLFEVEVLDEVSYLRKGMLAVGLSVG
jgi:hypothetical protein